MINDDLERLAARGPHQDPSDVVNAALSAARHPATTRISARLLVAAAAVVLVAGLVVVLASVSDDRSTPTVEPPAPMPAPSTDAPTATSTPLTGPALVECPPVEFGWSDPPAGTEVVENMIRSDRVGGGTTGFQVATDPYVFVTRGESFEDDFTLLPEQQAQVVPVSVVGSESEVRPPGTGVAGQNVSFVFPASASPEEPCNLWVINANTPMDTDRFVALVESLDMRQVEPTEPEPTVDGNGWTQLTDPPLEGRTDAIVANVDNNLVVVGGWTYQCPQEADCANADAAGFADGAIYDFESQAWSPVADSPIPIRQGTTATVGSDLYISAICGADAECAAGDLIMLRYRAGDNEWDVLAVPDQLDRAQLTTVGNEVIAYSATDEQGEQTDYRFLADEARWEPLPDDPLPTVFDRTIVDHDNKLYLFGSAIDSATGSKLAAVYDPATQTWTQLTESGTAGYQVWPADNTFYLNPHYGSPSAESAVATGGVYDPATDSWSSFPEPPQDLTWRNDMAGLIATNTANYAYTDGWVRDSIHDNWIRILPHPNINNAFDQTVAAIDRRLVVFGGQRWTGNTGQLLNETWIWTPPN